MAKSEVTTLNEKIEDLVKLAHAYRDASRDRAKILTALASDLADLAGDHPDLLPAHLVVARVHAALKELAGSIDKVSKAEA